MFSPFKTKNTKTKEMDAFNVEIDREIDYTKLKEQIKALDAKYPKVSQEDLFNPTVNEELNKQLTACVDKYIYHPGDVIKGTVTLTLSADVPAKSLGVLFYGGVTVKYGTSSRHTSVFNSEVVIWLYGGGGENAVMSAGTYRHNYEFVLPPDMLGTVFYFSTEGEGGLVAYHVRARINLSSGGTIQSDETFVPIQRLLYKGDPFIRQELWNAPPEKEEKESFCCTGGTITARCTLHPGIFTADGQDFLIDLHIVNSTRKIIRKVKAWITQTPSFWYYGGLAYTTDKIVAEIKVPVHIRPRDEQTLRGIHLPVPIGLEPSLDKHGGSRWAAYMDMKYSVSVGVYTGHYFPEPLIEFEEVIIGSQPQVGPEQQ